MVVAADEVVLARITHEDLGDVRPGHLGQPAAKPAFLQGQLSGGGRNGLQVLAQLAFGGGKAPVSAALTCVIHPGQNTKMGMGIQAQPRYAFLVLCFHKRTIFGVDGAAGLFLNNNPMLPETQVVRFSNYLLREIGWSRIGLEWWVAYASWGSG